jgi:hypothetical protein
LVTHNHLSLLCTIIMPVDVQIHPLLDSVDVFGAPDASSAYSLSGHISLTINPLRSFFGDLCSESYSLESLELIFEGQSELVSDVTGYSAVRLCSIKHQLVHGEPMKLKNEESLENGHSQAEKWEFVFDIPIPGWLPATSPFRDSHNGCQVGTQYTLYATARLRDLNKEERPGLLNSVFCGIFRPSSIIQTARCPITLKRFYTIPFTSLDQDQNPATFPVIPYFVKSSKEHPSIPANDQVQVIPREVLDTIEVVIELPEHCCLDRSQIPFTLRVRPGKGFPQNAFERTKVVGFNLDVRQQESYR